MIKVLQAINLVKLFTQTRKSFLRLTVFSDDTCIPDNNITVNKIISEKKSRMEAINRSFDIQSDEKGTAMTAEVRV